MSRDGTVARVAYHLAGSGNDLRNAGHDGRAVIVVEADLLDWKERRMLDRTVFSATEPLATVLWVLWFVVAARAIWRLLEWHNEWFVATDRRILLVYGLLVTPAA